MRALASGVKISGCTVHFVRTEMDEGPIVAQAAVPVLEGDTPRRSPTACCTPSIVSIRWRSHLVASGAVKVEGERVIGTMPEEAQAAAVFPLPGKGLGSPALTEIINGVAHHDLDVAGCRTTR